MDPIIITQLFDETLLLAEEQGATATLTEFTQFVEDFLPSEVLLQLEEINGSDAFIEDIFNEKYLKVADEEQEELGEQFESGCCLVCERKTRLTRHHVFPREIHKSLIKKGYDSSKLNTTIPICRMCHNTIHRFFSNHELAESYYTVDLLMQNSKFSKYAQWASAQTSRPIANHQ